MSEIHASGWFTGEVSPLLRSRLALLLSVVGVLLAASCSSVERPVLTAETIPPEPEALVDEPVVEPDELPLVEPEPVGPARALITPTGVVVPVIGEMGSSYLVTTPCGNEAEVLWGTPVYSIDIVLDPGHGGKVETGAVGPNGLAEKDLNLDVAKRTARILEQRGFSVILTRTSDYRMPLSVRSMVADELQARAIVSIHHNAPNANRSETPGTEVFIQRDSDESRRLGGLLWEEIVGALEQFDVEWTTATDAGALLVLNDEGEESYGMVRRPTVPAVLAELAYLSNEPEAELLETPEYRVAAATALADGLERWLDTDDPGSGFVDEPRSFTPSGLTGGSDGCEDPDLG